MYINMFDLTNLIKKRQTNRAYVDLPFGSAIRFKRQELNMTLEEACENICSLSYLSKVENNLISASEEYVEKFKERFQLNDAYDYDVDTFKIHVDHIISACLKNEELQKSLMYYYEEREDYQSLLIELAHYVLKKDYKNAEMPYRNLLSLISSMPSDAFMITVILINRILYHEMRYIDGMNLIKLTETREKLSGKIRLLVDKWKLNHSFKLNNHLLISKMYQPIQNDLTNSHLFNQVQANCVSKLIYESKHKSCEDMALDLSTIISINQEKKDYIMARCLLFSGKYNKVLELSKSYFKNSPKWLNLHLLALDHLEQKKAIFQIMNEHSQQDDPLYLVISKHLKIKYNGSQDEIIEYIKKDIMSQLITDDYEILVYLMKECDTLLTKFQHYKSAVSAYRFFIHKFNKMANT